MVSISGFSAPGGYASIVEEEVEFALGGGVVSVTEPGGERAESVGAIRTHLAAQHIAAGRRSLAVCSPGRGIGCTSLAVNLAVSLAESGVNTLLIDADLRDPAVDEFLIPSRTLSGLRQCLGDERLPFTSAIRYDVLPNLSVLYSGGRAERSQELLATPRFGQLVDQALREFQFTIADTSPSNASADARQVARVLGNALMVVGRNATFLSDAKLFAEELTADRTHVVGSVLSTG